MTLTDQAQPEQVLIPVKEKVRPWWQKVDTEYLLKRLRTSVDRMEVAAILVELADRAERNPVLQERLKKMQLRPPFNVMEYVKPYNKKGFWRRIPFWREHPTEAQLKAKLELSEIAYSLFGEKGTVERPDGTQIPRLTQSVGERMRGMNFLSEEEQAERQRQKSVARIVEAVAPTCP